MSHWDKHAQQWSNIGHPLRPSDSDLQIIRTWLGEIIPLSSKPFNVLILGATPELAQIDWPSNTCLFIVDAKLSMIQSVLLTQKITVNPIIAVGDWLQLPIPNAYIDLVIGDGCYSMLAAYDYDRLSQEIRRILVPNGYFFMRFFIRPEIQESLDTIHQEFIAGKIANFHILKWRIAMSLHGTLEQGVCLDTIWQVWNTQFKPLITPWPAQSIETIHVYKNSLTCYTFPTLQEIQNSLSKNFIHLNIHSPSYPLGERCPTFKLQSLL